MTTFIRRSLALLGVALALSGCVVYPAGYGYRYPAGTARGANVSYGYGPWY